MKSKAKARQFFWSSRMHMRPWGIPIGLTFWRPEESSWKAHQKSSQRTPGLKKLTLVSRLLRNTILLATISSLVLTLSCARQSQVTNAPDRSSIKIGYFGDLSGPTFNFGQSAINGVLMAVVEINQEGGINGRKLDVVIDDDHGSPEQSATLAGQLIGEDKVVAIIAGGTSSNSRAAAPKAQSAKIPLISPSSTDPGVTQVGDYIFRACFVDAFQAEVMAKFAVNTLKAKKAAILFDFNSPYGRGLTDYFELSLARQ